MISVGYLLLIVNNLNGNDGSYSFLNWLYYRPSSVFGWAVLGGVLGLLWHTIARLESTVSRP